ncbi:hypothetical protein [Actinomadura sp. 9N215]|uniref:hypothetical protein n=1 Tax=Actinomadura sp. 9N215 TaxID=3375150 RepID=UPI0037AFE257
MRRWRTALISTAALAALLVPLQPAAADGPAGPPSDGFLSGPLFHLGHAKTKVPARASAAADHTITIRGFDLDGKALAPLARLIDLATGSEYVLTESGGTLTGVVPAGDYSLTGLVITGPIFDPRDLALYGNPTLTVGADVDLTLDARTATEIKAVSPSPTATEFQSHAKLVQTIAGQELSTSISGRPDISLRAWPSATTTRPYHFAYVESQTEPLTTLPSPRAYKLAFPVSGRIPADLTFTATEDSLALVNTTYASQGVPSEEAGPHSTAVGFDGIGGEALGLTTPASAPSTQRVYYTAEGVRWTGNYLYVLDTLQVAERQSEPRVFKAGGTYSETWNKAAFGPTMPVGHGQGQIIARPLVTDTGQVGHENFSGNISRSTTGTLTLYRNGQQVGVSTNPLAGDWTVPPASAAYRLDLALQRTAAWSKYATKVNASWTFPSAERPGDPFDDMRRLLQPRITGNYDGSGRAPSGATFPLDVVVERAVNGTAVTSSSLEASFNDGATWTTVPLTPNGTDRFTANVAHPTTHNGFVALRFKAADGSGNAVQQTVTRAYGLR